MVAMVVRQRHTAPWSKPALEHTTTALLPHAALSQAAAACRRCRHTRVCTPSNTTTPRAGAAQHLRLLPARTQRWQPAGAAATRPTGCRPAQSRQAPRQGSQWAARARRVFLRWKQYAGQWNHRQHSRQVQPHTRHAPRCGARARHNSHAAPASPAARAPDCCCCCCCCCCCRPSRQVGG
jgi:hypothetical protein